MSTKLCLVASFRSEIGHHIPCVKTHGDQVTISLPLARLMPIDIQVMIIFDILPVLIQCIATLEYFAFNGQAKGD